MDRVLHSKVNIGISACMFGAKVRYNGKGWDLLTHLGRERSDFIWHPVCPEVMSGMGVPRAAIRVAGSSGREVWSNQAKILSRGGVNVSERLKMGVGACINTLDSAEVDAFVFMEGSPSCGVYRTTLKNRRIGKPPGVFGAKMLEKQWFLIPAQELQSPIKWWDWRRRLHAFVWLKHQELDQVSQLFEIWHTLKFLCQEVDEPKARELGHEIASLSKKTGGEVLEAYRAEMLEILRQPSTVAKIKNRLWKHYVYLRKHLDVQVEEIQKPNDVRGMTKIAEELILLERLAWKSGTFFASAPIIYRGNRTPAVENVEEQ